MLFAALVPAHQKGQGSPQDGQGQPAMNSPQDHQQQLPAVLKQSLHPAACTKPLHSLVESKAPEMPYTLALPHQQLPCSVPSQPLAVTSTLQLSPWPRL